MDSFYTTQQEGDLVTQYKGLVTSLAYTFARKNNACNELDDYIQICNMGLLRAIRKYKGINSLSTMAWRYIRWEMLNHITRTKSKYQCKLNNFYVENVATQEPLYNLDEYLPTLSKDESNILTMRLSGFTFMEIGTVIGFSRYTARKRYMSIINKIKVVNQEL